MSDPAVARRDLGRRLATTRKTAGYTQEQLAAAIDYSRGAVSNAETGHPDVARAFWARCDGVLKTRRAFVRAFDEIRASELRAAAGLPDTELPEASRGPGVFARARQRACSMTPAEALAGYEDLGWPSQPAGDGADLITGDVLEALELPRAAGMLAVSLWLYSRGRPDEIRRLPALPSLSDSRET